MSPPNSKDWVPLITKYHSISQDLYVWEEADRSIRRFAKKFLTRITPPWQRVVKISNLRARIFMRKLFSKLKMTCIRWILILTMFTQPCIFLRRKRIKLKSWHLRRNRNTSLIEKDSITLDWSRSRESMESMARKCWDSCQWTQSKPYQFYMNALSLTTRSEKVREETVKGSGMNNWRKTSTSLSIIGLSTSSTLKRSINRLRLMYQRSETLLRWVQNKSLIFSF